MGTFILYLCLGFIFVSEGKKSYEGYKVLSLQTKEERYTLFKDIVDKYELDVWKEAKLPVPESHVMVSPQNEERVIRALAKLGFKWSFHIENVQSEINKEKLAISQRRQKHGQQKVYDYNNFNEFDEFEVELQRLASQCPDGFQCEVYSIGQSFEGNGLNVLSVTVPGAQRTGYWLDAMTHAREWLAGATHMNIARKLIEEYGTDAEATYLLDNYDWYFLPVVNPDGYIYTWTDERLWRKNRRQNAGSECFGTDLNRNYEYEWGGVGASTNPCSDTYRGDGPASEPVTQHIMAEMARLANNLNAWVTMHTYGRLFLTSWAFEEANGDCAFPQDYDEIYRVADAAATAIENTHGYNWTPGNWCEVLYSSSGVLQDHAKGQEDITYSFTPELRGNSFIVEPEEIQPSFEEVWNGIVAMVAAIEQA